MIDKVPIIFLPLNKIGCTSKIKKMNIILYFAQLALSLQPILRELL